MYVLDHIVPTDILDNIIKAQEKDSDKHLWKFTRTDTLDDIYWTQLIYGNNYNANKELSYEQEKFTSLEVKSLWDWFSEVTNISIKNLESCYINGLTYGTEAFAHVDFQKDEIGSTCIFYINPEWHSQWGGETVFYDGQFVEHFNDAWYYEHDLVKSVLPRYNRLMVFDGRVTHSVRPLSKTFKGLRQTLMFKLHGIHAEHIKESLCNYSKEHTVL